MKAVILAAGEGKRMHPLTYTRPKAMLPLANRPLLEHLLIEIKGAGIDEFIFVVGYRSEKVRDYFGKGEQWGVRIEYVTQMKQLGTADAVKTVRGLVGKRFLVVNGDVLVKARDISKLLAKNSITLGLVEKRDTLDLGVVEVQDGRVTHIYEKVENPTSNLVNTGVYLFTPEIFSAVSATPKSPRGEYEITDSLQALIDSEYTVHYEMLTSWRDLSYPWDLLGANESLLSQLKPANLGEMDNNVVVKGPLWVGEGTTVKSGTYIVGPVVIGKNCDIGPNCFIRPSTAIGDNCHIGNGVEIKNSIIMRGSKVPHLSYVGDSVIGEDCNLGAGTKTANLRLDKKNISILGIDTKMHKLGAILGDGVQTGINVSLNVGCMIGNDSFVGPGAAVSGVILPYSKMF